MTVAGPNALPSEYKYTDTDVRRNQGTAALFAMEYLRDYAGDFEPLIGLKMTYEARGLTVPQIRTVLNCARHDPYVTLPAMYPTRSLSESDPEGDVIPMVRRRTKKQKQKLRRCDIKEYHEAHGHFGSYVDVEDPKDPYMYCYGKYEFHRQDFRLPVRIKYPFMVGKSRQTIHRVSQDEASFVLWTPNTRTLGYARPPVLKARPACRRPHILSGPTLIKKLVNPFRIPDLDDPKLCQHCFPEFHIHLMKQEADGEKA